jgi:hypothetical protein
MMHVAEGPSMLAGFEKAALRDIVQGYSVIPTSRKIGEKWGTPQ